MPVAPYIGLEIFARRGSLLLRILTGVGVGGCLGIQIFEDLCPRSSGDQIQLYTYWDSILEPFRHVSCLYLDGDSHLKV